MERDGGMVMVKERRLVDVGVRRGALRMEEKDLPAPIMGTTMRGHTGGPVCVGRTAHSPGFLAC